MSSDLSKELKSYLEKNVTAKFEDRCKRFKDSLDFSQTGISDLSNNELLEAEEKNTVNLGMLEKSDFPNVPGEGKIKISVKQWYETNMREFNKRKSDAEKRRERLKNEFIEEYENQKDEALKNINSIIVDYKNKLNEIYRPICIIREQSAEIEKFAADYGIDLSIYTIDFQNMSLSEIKEISVVAEAAINETLQGRKGFSAMLVFLYLPLYLKPFDDNRFNVLFMAFYMLLLVSVIIAANPIAMGMISFLVIVQAVGNLVLAVKNHKLISAAYSISCNFDRFDKRISELISNEPAVKEFMEKYNRLCCENTDLLLEEKLSEINREISELLEASPENDLKKTRAEAESSEYIKPFIEEMKKIRSRYVLEFNNKLADYKRYCGNISKEIDKRAEQASPPGVPVNGNYYMDFSFKASVTSAKDGRIIGYNTIKLPFKNILFRYGSETERNERIKTLKLMLSSMLGNVRENFLEVTIVDTEQLGRQVSEFLTKPLRNTIKLVTSEWDKTFKMLFDTAKENMLTVGTGSFNEHNKQNAFEGKTTLEYRIVIILSTDKPLWSDKVFLKFKNYSADMGVWLWLVHGEEKLYIKDKKPPDGINELLDFPVIISSDSCFKYNNESVSFCDEGKFTEPLYYSESIGMKSVQNLAETIKNGRMDIIEYETQYRQRHIPDSKIWTYSTLDGIELHFGFLDGDRANPNIEWLGSDGAKPVHCLMAGETGAGKSATINQVLANLLHMYSPEELELIMIDFKNVEFNMYTGDLLIPHAKLIAGTTDGEYALSVFEYLIKEMKRRQAEFGRYKFQNITDWNKAVLSGKIKEKYMPRILFLCDEFQVMVRP